MTEIRCIACRTELRDDATLCPVCKTHQQPWLNRSLIGAQLIGLISVIAAATVFAVSKFPDARRALSPLESVRIVAYDGARSLTVANTGDNPVLILSVSAGLKRGSFPTAQSIDRVLGPGEVSTYEVAPETAAVFKGRSVYSPYAGAEWDATWSAAAEIASRSASDASACLLYDVFDQRDAQIEYLRSFYARQLSQTLRTLDASLTVTWTSLRSSEPRTVSSPAVAVLYLKDPRCLSEPATPASPPQR